MIRAKKARELSDVVLGKKCIIERRDLIPYISRASRVIEIAALSGTRRCYLPIPYAVNSTMVLENALMTYFTKFGYKAKLNASRDNYLILLEW